MTKNLAAAKTPGVAVARVLRGLGLKQGTDFGVRAVRKNGERIGTRVAVFGAEANQTVADNADLIEKQAGAAGFHFNVSVYFSPSGIVWVDVANFGTKTRQHHFLSATPAEPTEAAEDQPLRDRAVALADDSMAKPMSPRAQDVAYYYPKGQRVKGVDNYGVTCWGTVNGAGWGAVTDPNHENHGRTWVDVTWDEMPHNRGTGRRSRHFTSGLIQY